LGFNSPSLNPENVLPQWQQKIAIAENKYSSISITFGPVYFPHEVRFSVTYWRSQFSGSMARLLMPVPLPFSPSFIESISTCYILFLFSISRNGRCKDNDFFAIIGKEKDKNALFEGIK
jgi:hypothetical protein